MNVFESIRVALRALLANKLRGIRASVCHDIYSAHQCVEHDDVNVAAVGAQIIGQRVAEETCREELLHEGTLRCSY